MLVNKLIATLLAVLALVSLNANLSLAQDLNDDFREKIGDAVVLYLDSPYTLVNGKSGMIDPNNTELCPIEKQGRTLVPLRFVAENFGASVEWDSKKNAATVRSKNTNIVITLGARNMLINGTNATLDVPAQMISSRTYVPLRAVSEAMEKKILYQRGLIFISDRDKITDKELDDVLLDELIFLCTGRGNSSSNLMSWSSVASQGDWIFYSNSLHKNMLYKSKMDGTKVTRLSSDHPCQINVIGKWIYYLVYTNKKPEVIGDYESTKYLHDIYKIRTDGTGRTRINQEKCLMWMAVVGDNIYYINEANNLCRIKIDGSDRTTLIGGVNESGVAIEDGWIYYSPLNNDGNSNFDLYRVRADGTGKMQLVDEIVSFYDFKDDWIYYSIFEGIYKMRRDGSEKTAVLLECNVNNLHIKDDWIYFRDWEKNGKLFRATLDGHQVTRLNNDDSLWMGIFGDWIYCTYNWTNVDPRPLYKLKLDGSEQQKVY